MLQSQSMEKTDIIRKLGEISSPAPSNWREHAQWRKDNREWLRVSGGIALHLLYRSTGSDEVREYIKETMSCDDATAGNILKGTHDFTLAEIRKLIGYEGFREVAERIRNWKEKNDIQ